MIVQDPTLVHQVDLFGGLGEDGYVLLNTGRSFGELGLGEYMECFSPGRGICAAECPCSAIEMVPEEI